MKRGNNPQGSQCMEREVLSRENVQLDVCKSSLLVVYAAILCALG